MTIRSILHKGWRWLRQEGWFLLPIAVGFGLRFADLGKQGLFLDEAFSADLVSHSWKSMIVVGFRDVHPLFFYILLKGFLLVFPMAEWSLRFISAACSITTLVFSMLVTRRLVGYRAAIWVGWVLAWSSLHLYYAQEARMYGFFDLLWFLSAWLLYQSLRSPKKWLWFGWAIITGMAIHTHFYGLVLWGVGALVGGYILWNRRSWKEFRWWGIAQAITVLMTVPLMLLIISTVQKGVGGTWVPTWTSPIDLWLLALVGFTPVRFNFLNGGLLSMAPWDVFPRTGWIILGFILGGGAVVGWWHRWRKAELLNEQKVMASLVFAFGILPPLLTAVFLGLTHQRFWAYRPLIGAATWLLIGLAVGWSAFPRRVAWVTLGLLFVINFGSLWSYKTLWVKDYGRSAFQSWGEQVPAGTALILDRDYRSYVWNFYRPDQGPIPVFGIAVRPDHQFAISRLISDGTLRGQSQEAACAEIEAQSSMSLYDPDGRRFSEGASWPACLRGRPGWTFNPKTNQWDAVPVLIP